MPLNYLNLKPQIQSLGETSQTRREELAQKLGRLPAAANSIY